MLILSLMIFGCSSDDGEDSSDGDFEPISDDDDDTSDDDDDTSDDDDDTSDDDDDTSDDDDDTTFAGSISGTVYFGETEAALDTAIMLFDEPPFGDDEDEENEPVMTVSFSAHPGELQKTYTFANIEPRPYWMVAFVDANGNSDIDLDELIVPHPEGVIEITLDSVYEGKDFYLGVQNDSWGSISGAIHLSEPWQEKNAVVFVTADAPSSTLASILGFTFSAAAAGTDTRQYTIPNLPDGAFYIYAVVDFEAEQPLVCLHDVDSDTIDTTAANGGHLTGIDLYCGTINPNLGSISGTITISADVPGGLGAAVGVYDQEPVAGVQPISWAIATATADSKVFDYSVGNLYGGNMWVAAVYSKTLQLVSTDYSGPYAIDLDGTKDYDNVDFALSSSSLEGTLTIVNCPAADLDVFIRLNNANDQVGGYGVAKTTAVTGGSCDIAYSLFGVKTGTWNFNVAVDADSDGIDAEDPVAMATTFAQVDETQTVNTGDFTVTLP